MILWGPPGVGKTTLARLMADGLRCPTSSPSRRCSAGVKDIREAVEQAQAARSIGRRDDRLRRRGAPLQQGAAGRLPAARRSRACSRFIGATTENPSFEVNSALLSRATVHVLQPLERRRSARAARARARGAAAGAAAEPRPRATRLVAYADGDARRLLNTFENVAAHGRRARPSIDEPLLERALGEQLRRFDKGGDQFYDSISALHKTVRGSDPDAALYWLARMLDGGADPRYLARRMVRMAERGHRPGRSARAAAGARRGARSTSAWARPKASWRWRRRWSTWRWRRKSNARLHRLQRGARLRQAGRHAAGAGAPAQRADQADEEPGPRRATTATRTTRTTASPPARPTCPTASIAAPFYEPQPRGLETRSARSSPACARPTGVRASRQIDGGTAQRASRPRGARARA